MSDLPISGVRVSRAETILRELRALVRRQAVRVGGDDAQLQLRGTRLRAWLEEGH